jgi:hypothetical protein
MRNYRARIVFSFAALFAGLFGACGVSPTHSQSSISTVNIPQSSVKQQSIGNCWVYAALGWVESLAVRANGRELDLSESYLTYRFFQDSLLQNIPTKELDTSGNFSIAMDLIANYGIMHESDFIPSEANKPRSERQATALKILNESIKSGALAQLRDSAVSFSERQQIIQAELDRAFSVNMQALQFKVVNPSSINLGKASDGSSLTLSKLATSDYYRWNWVSFPFNGSSSPNGQPISMPLRSRAQMQVLQRVKRALNDGHPVLISWFVDFNALKGDAFDLNTLIAAQKPGRQGGHITVIEDYVASGINPVDGSTFRTPEGEISPSEKELALKFGNIDYFIVKNSWGAKPESSYYRDGSYGYHKLMANYAFGWIPENQTENSNNSIRYINSSFGVNEFILPPGY